MPLKTRSTPILDGNMTAIQPQNTLKFSTDESINTLAVSKLLFEF